MENFEYSHENFNLRKLTVMLGIILLLFLSPIALVQAETLAIPPNIFLKAILQSEISTRTNNLNDPVRAIISSNFYFIETICIPENSILTGQITEFELPKKGRDGLFRIKFNKLIFPNGTCYPVNAALWMDGSDLIGGKPSALNSVRPVTFSAGGLSPGYILMKPSGEYRIGKDVTIMAGSEVLIKTNSEMKLSK